MVKIIFLVDNIPAIEMFLPIIKELPDFYEVLIINYDGWTNKKRAEIEQVLQNLRLNYITIKSRGRRYIEKLLQKEKPSVVVLSRDTTTPFEQYIIKYANFKHIPTLLVPHGMWTPQARKNWSLRAPRAFIEHLYRLLFQGLKVKKAGDFSWSRLIRTGIFRLRHDVKRRPLFDGHGGCTKIAVFGDSMKELLISEGVGPEHIVVTGNPKFDFIYHTKASDNKSELCQSLGIPTDEDIILLLTDYLVEFGLWTTAQRKEFVMAISEAVAKLPGCKLVIKLHPVLENKLDYLNIIKDIPALPLICQTVSLPELLNVCSVAITVRSTAGLEAMAMDKPLLVINLFNDITLFDETNCAMVVRSKSDLLSALEAILCSGLSKEKKEAINKFVYQQAYIQDGKAAKRIADLISKMVREAVDFK